MRQVRRVTKMSVESSSSILMRQHWPQPSQSDSHSAWVISSIDFVAQNGGFSPAFDLLDDTFCFGLLIGDCLDQRDNQLRSMRCARMLQGNSVSPARRRAFGCEGRLTRGTPLREDARSKIPNGRLAAPSQVGRPMVLTVSSVMATMAIMAMMPMPVAKA